MKKRAAVSVLAVILSGLLLCSFFAFAEAPGQNLPEVEYYSGNSKAPRTYETAAERNGMVLGVDFNHAAIALTDREGHIWTSTPDRYEEDEIANGGAKMAMASLIQITYSDRVGNPKTVNGYSDSVRPGHYGCRKIDGGVRFDFVFERVGITVPVQFVLNDQGMEASVLADEIREENEDYALTGVTLMPYFGSALPKEDGYFLLPDGSGALVEFQKAPLDCAPYEQQIYGRELSVSRRKADARTQQALLPVFGVKKENSAFLAVMTEGAAEAVLQAESAGGRTERFSLAPRFVYRISDLILVEKKNQTVRMTQEWHSTVKKYTVSYRFLSGEQADYNGMAAAYRAYLQNEKGMKQTDAPADQLFLTMIGGAKATVNVLGFPVDRVQCLTGFEDARNILADLTEQGVGPVSAAYTAWQHGGAECAMPDRIRPDGSLGGKAGFSELIGFCSEKQIALYPEVDPVWIYRGRIGRMGQNSGVKNIQRGPAEQYHYRLSDGGANLTMPRYLLNHQAVSETCHALSDSRKKDFSGLNGLGATVLGHTLYSDFGRRRVCRGEAERMFCENLRDMSQDTRLMFSAPCGYALPYASAVTDAPESASAFTIETASVPFYQMALRGLVPVSSEEINRSADPELLLLRCAQLGMTPHFSLLARNEDKVYKTCLSDVTSGLYTDWRGNLLEAAARLKPVLEAAGNSPIRSCRTEPSGAGKTEFENGAVVYVNLSDQPAEIDGKKLEPRSFCLEKAA